MLRFTRAVQLRPRSRMSLLSRLPEVALIGFAYPSSLEALPTSDDFEEKALKTSTENPLATLPYPKKGLRYRGEQLNPALDRQTRFQETIHEHHWTARTRTINALADPEFPSHHAAAQRMAKCGNGASFYIDPERDQVRPWISRCGHRLCPFCSNARSASTAEALTELMLNHAAERMIILTMRSHDLPLDLQVASLLHCFKKLRNRASWKRHVTGGVYVLEVTRNKDTGLWHPHLHILVRGKYYPHAELSKQWRQITKGSNVVWATKVNDIAGAAIELAKYIGKPQRVAELDASEIREYASAVKNVRMTQTFGDLHGRKPADSADKQPEPRSDIRVRLSTLLHVSRSGYAEAIVLLTWLCRRYKIFGRYVHHEAPQMFEDPGQHDHVAAMIAIARGQPPTARKLPADELPDEELDRKICRAFELYKTRLDAGGFPDVTWYHRTETEEIGRHEDPADAGAIGSTWKAP